MDESWVPTVALSLALVLHVSWFQAGVVGYMKRRQKAQQKVRSANGVPASHCETYSATSAERQEAGLRHEEEADSGEETPYESPLVTPRTPGASPFPLGSLSNLSLPSIPTMPLPPSLTTFAHKLPRTAMDLQTGFKEAVRVRWEGQKERFETGSMGMGMGRLRRRRVSEEEDGVAVMEE